MAAITLIDEVRQRSPSDLPPAIVPISADSHVTEPPNCYRDYIDPKFRDRAPHVVRKDNMDLYVIEGINNPIPMGLVASAGRDPKEILKKHLIYPELHEGGWDPKARIREQDEDGVAAEIVYPTVGMVLFNCPDLELQNASIHAYNRWLQEFCAGAPDRLFGIAQTAVRSVEEAVENLARIKEMGFKGAMLPGYPNTEFDYDDERFDPLWRASAELELPVSFHVFAGQRDIEQKSPRGGIAVEKTINQWTMAVRQNQDIMGMLIFGSVFERNPELQTVFVEGDAGWVPHFTLRMDHMYKRHRYWQKMPPLGKLPGEYFREHIYLTFQDDFTAFQTAHLMNPHRLLWANDYPHSDAIWPHSQQIIDEHTQELSDEYKRLILRDNVKTLYQLDIA